MRGSTRKRGKTWTAYYDAGVDLETGERRQKTKGGFRTQKAAQQFLADVVTQLGHGTYSEPSKQPLATFMTSEWLPAVRGQLRPLSAAKYAQVTRSHVAGRDVGSVPLRALSPGHLNGLYAELERDGLSTATRRQVHVIIGHALSDAVRWGKISRNPAKQADPPALPRSRAQAWTARELRTFLEHVQDDRLFAVWRLGATTGMRRGELLGLTWRELDFKRSRLRVSQQVIPARGGAAFGPPKTRRSERTVALDAVTVEALNDHRAVQLLERDLAGPAYEDGDLVFCDELGRLIHPNTLTKAFRDHRKAAGIPSGTLHILRHTSATLALTATPPVPLHVVAGRLGDDPATVLGHYAHLLPHSDQDAANVIAEVLV